MNRRHLLLATTLAPLLAACGRDDLTGEWYSDWDLAGGCAAGNANRSAGPVRVDASGRSADICPPDPGGDIWTWVLYGAEWCPASRSQAAHMREFDHRCREWVDVLSVFTGAEPLVPPLQREALAWAARTGLPPERVLFAPREADSRVVPQHLLLNPAGNTVWRWNGVLRADEMLDVAVGFRMGLRQPNLRRGPQR